MTSTLLESIEIHSSRRSSNIPAATRQTIFSVLKPEILPFSFTEQIMYS